MTHLLWRTLSNTRAHYKYKYTNIRTVTCALPSKDHSAESNQPTEPWDILNYFEPLRIWMVSYPAIGNWTTMLFSLTTKSIFTHTPSTLSVILFAVRSWPWRLVSSSLQFALVTPLHWRPIFFLFRLIIYFHTVFQISVKDLSLCGWEDKKQVLLNTGSAAMSVFSLDSFQEYNSTI